MRCLFILGMHRSGTSLVSQALCSAGISPGPLSELLSAQADNPEGFYENKRLVELNDALIAKAGGHWYSPPSAEAIAAAKVDMAGDMSALLLHLEAAVHPADTTAALFFLKDPRLCLTWQSWLPLTERNDVVFVYRSPLAVARSLARRNQFPLQFGLLLWEYYNRAALAAISGVDAEVVCYDLIATGKYDLGELAENLSQRGYSCDPNKARKVFSGDLNHSGVGDMAVGLDDAALLSPSQKVLHDYCMQLCRGGSAGSSLEPYDDVLARRQLSDMGSALAPLASVMETLAEHKAALELVAERTEERDRALKVLSTLDQEHRELAQAHDTEVAAHGALTEDHKRLLSLHDSLHSEFEQRGQLQRQLYADIDGMRADFAELEGRRAALEARYTQQSSDYAALTVEHRELQDKTEYLFFSLNESYRRLLTFELSTMARMQRYTRSAYRLLTGRRGQNSAYDDLLESAHAHFDEFALEKPVPKPNKLKMAGDVFRYVRQNPAGSARSFSWPRLRRAVSVFFGKSSDDLAVWVNARFPDAETNTTDFDPDALSADLDALVLAFPTTESPVVSIVIPVFNDYRMTINCLQSVHRFTQDVNYEVIIADDCSTDLTSTIGERMHGIKVSRTHENLRFLKNCNQAAQHARGQYLVFLNNDTAVTKAWLSSLLEPFKDHKVGVAGPMLLFADGALQEAGGIIWNDASGWNFGRSDNRDKPAYNYRREVDYVSGACLAIRHELWTQLGGFDERFAPAYYEDADICFSARSRGFRVVYQPQSVVYHFEGVSNGTDLNAGVKQHQVVNQEVFREKWQQELKAHHFPNAEHVVHARDRSARKPCVLLIDHYVPHHDKDAGGRSTFMYLELLLALGCRVQLMGANFFPHQPYTRALQAMGVEVLVGESIARHLDEWLAEHAPYIDEIFLHRPHIAEQMLPHLERMSPRPTISFFGHDLHYLRIAREAALKDDDGLRRDSESWRKRELAVCERVDRVYYFSDVEIEALSELMPAAKLRRVPLYAMQLGDLAVYAPLAPSDLLFVGGYNHPPNVDAAIWLVKEILPTVRVSIPDAQLHLVGSNPPAEVQALATDHVQVHGYVSDDTLNDLYRRVGAVVVPLRYGAGIKGKIIEAIANHVPVVTTDIGVEGIPESDLVMWVENTATGIADRLVALLLDRESKAAKLDQHAQWLRTHFDRGVAASALREDMPKLGHLSGSDE